MIFKRVKNGKRNKVSIDSRVDYIHKSAVWESCSHFDFKSLMKSSQYDEKSSHFVISFDDDSVHRDSVQGFIERRFSEHLVYIGEHTEKRKDQKMTAYHIVLSRNLATGLMINLSKQDLKNLKSEWYEDIRDDLNTQQQEKIDLWKEQLKEKQAGLEPWQTDNPEKSYKAFSMQLKEQFISKVNNSDFEGAFEFLKCNKASFEIKRTEASRERLYLTFKWGGKMKSVSLSRIDRNVKEELKRIAEVIDGYAEKLRKTDVSCEECKIKCRRTRKISGDADERDQCVRRQKEEDSRKFHEKYSQLDGDVGELEQEFERVYGRSQTANIRNMELESVIKHDSDAFQYFNVNSDLQKVLNSQVFKKALSLAEQSGELDKELREFKVAAKSQHPMGFKGFIRNFNKEFAYQAKRQKDPVISTALTFLSIVTALVSMMAFVAQTGYKYSKTRECRYKMKELAKASADFAETDQRMKEIEEIKNTHQSPDCDFDMTM